MGESTFSVPLLNRLGDWTEIAVTSAFATKLHETNSKTNGKNWVKGEWEAFDFPLGIERTHVFGNDTSSMRHTFADPSAANLYAR